jgi:hypothetical protein
LDEYLKSELVLYLAHSPLAQQSVTALMLPTFLEHYSTIIKLLARELDLNSRSQFITALHRFLFPFDWVVQQEYMGKYHLLLSEFLGDPRRSKEFYIDGDKFATLAKTFAENIFTPFKYASLFSLLSNHIDYLESWSVILTVHLKFQHIQ